MPRVPNPENVGHYLIVDKGPYNSLIASGRYIRNPDNTLSPIHPTSNQPPRTSTSNQSSRTSTSNQPSRTSTSNQSSRTSTSNQPSRRQSPLDVLIHNYTLRELNELDFSYLNILFELRGYNLYLSPSKIKIDNKPLLIAIFLGIQNHIKPHENRTSERIMINIETQRATMTSSSQRVSRTSSSQRATMTSSSQRVSRNNNKGEDKLCGLCELEGENKIVSKNNLLVCGHAICAQHLQKFIDMRCPFCRHTIKRQTFAKIINSAYN
jgi:hypothetical protein